MKNVLETVEGWLDAGEPAWLALVVDTWGSAPRPVGSALAISVAGDSVGSVSSGCVEGDVLAAALAMSPDSAPQMLEFGVSQETAWAASLTCGGTIRILLLPVAPDKRAVLTQLRRRLGQRKSAALSINLQTGALDVAASSASHPGAVWPDGPSGSQVAIHYPPLPRLIISGMGHLGEQVAAAAHLCDFDVWVIDPRPAFTSGKKLASGSITDGWPDEVLEDASIDPLSAMLALSHDPKIDDPLLLKALASPAFYVGALGSRKSHAKRLERLKAAGQSDAALARIRGPVGLAIGAKGAGEIALSIVADIIAEFRALHAPESP